LLGLRKATKAEQKTNIKFSPNVDKEVTEKIRKELSKTQEKISAMWNLFSKVGNKIESLVEEKQDIDIKFNLHIVASIDIVDPDFFKEDFVNDIKESMNLLANLEEDSADVYIIKEGDKGQIDEYLSRWVAAFKKREDKIKILNSLLVLTYKYTTESSAYTEKSIYNFLKDLKEES
jgi:hemerythrin superfamily protein